MSGADPIKTRAALPSYECVAPAHRSSALPPSTISRARWSRRRRCERHRPRGGVTRPPGGRPGDPLFWPGRYSHPGLGNPKIDEARLKAVAEIVDRADQRPANVVPIMRQIQRSGATSLRQIAEALNARGISAPRGGQWHATSVRNVMARA
jgi:Recombinase